MTEVLTDRFSLYKNFELINGDVLKVNLEDIIKTNLKSYNLSTAKVVANLPYYITTPIIMKLLEEKLDLDSITVMVQKEVAIRLTSLPGAKECGAITYAINYYSNPEILLNVPNNSFIPAPKVDSAVIKLDILKEPKIKVIDEELFFQIIKYAFMQKRKTLLNSLSIAGILSKDDLAKMLIDLNIDIGIRAERLSLKDFANITEYLYTNKNNLE